MLLFFDIFAVNITNFNAVKKYPEYFILTFVYLVVATHFYINSEVLLEFLKFVS